MNAERTTVRFNVDVPVQLAPLVMEFARVQGFSSSRALGAFVASHRLELESVIDAHKQASAIRDGEGLPLLRLV